MSALTIMPKVEKIISEAKAHVLQMEGSAEEKLDHLLNEVERALHLTRTGEDPGERAGS